MTITTMVLVAVLSGLAGCAYPVSVNQKGSGSVQVLSATYGANCGAPKGNVTEHLAKACDTTAKCEYRIDHQVIGDPRRGCPKSYEAEYRCSNYSGVRTVTAPAEAGGGTVVTLECLGLFGIF